MLTSSYLSGPFRPDVTLSQVKPELALPPTPCRPTPATSSSAPPIALPLEQMLTIAQKGDELRESVARIFSLSLVGKDVLRILKVWAACATLHRMRHSSSTWRSLGGSRRPWARF